MTDSSFFCDGYRDAEQGKRPSPPTHGKTTVYASEYLAGYRAGQANHASDCAV